MPIILAETTVHNLPPPILAALCPWFVFGIVLGLVLGCMARRKGRNPFLWFAIGLIPLFSIFAGIYLASLPDTYLLNRLWALEEKLEKLCGEPKPPELSDTKG